MNTHMHIHLQRVVGQLGGGGSVGGGGQKWGEHTYTHAYSSTKGRGLGEGVRGSEIQNS